MDDLLLSNNRTFVELKHNDISRIWQSWPRNNRTFVELKQKMSNLVL